MTQRDMTASMITEVAKQKNEPFHLYDFYFDSGTIYLTDAGMNLTWSSNTYTNAGKALGFDAIEESVEVEVTEIQIHLTGVASDIISTVLTEDFIDRRVIVRKGFLNSSGAIIADPVVIFDGRMDGPSLSEDPLAGTADIVVPAANHFVDFETTNGRRTNSTEQKKLFSTDKGFDFVPSLTDKVIRWGR